MAAYNGEIKSWHLNGQQKAIEHFRLGYCFERTEWDANGNETSHFLLNKYRDSWILIEQMEEQCKMVNDAKPSFNPDAQKVE